MKRLCQCSACIKISLALIIKICYALFPPLLCLVDSGTLLTALQRLRAIKRHFQPFVNCRKNDVANALYARDCILFIKKWINTPLRHHEKSNAMAILAPKGAGLLHKGFNML